MRVLLVAHELSAKLGSEAGSAFELIMELAKRVDVTILYAKTNQLNSEHYYLHNERKLIENGIRSFPVEQVYLAGFNRYLKNVFKLSNIGFAPLYFVLVKFWEYKVFRISRKIEYKYDVVHHLNHITFREPSFLALLSKPVVLGPKSGTDLVMIDFFHGLDKFYYFSRNLWINLAKLSPFQLLYFKTSMILAVSKSDAKYFRRFSDRVEIMLDTSLGNSAINTKTSSDQLRKKVLWIGRVDKLKALDIFLEVAKRAAHLNFEFLIIGEGPELSHHMNKKVPDNLSFLGRISRSEVQNQLRNASILLHTSLKEASSAVIMEALDNGVCVVAHDAFGMSSLVDKGLIQGVRYVNREESIQGFYDALRSNFENQKSSEVMNEELTLAGKVTRLINYYQEICES